MLGRGEECECEEDNKEFEEVVVGVIAAPLRLLLLLVLPFPPLEPLFVFAVWEDCGRECMDGLELPGGDNEPVARRDMAEEKRNGC